MSDASSKTGMRLIVAVAAPVSMLVDPGPIEAVHASAAVRCFALANPMAVCTMDCSLRGWKYGSSWPYSNSAWLRPATLPWPKMPNMAGIRRCSLPSRSLYCDCRYFTSA